MSRGVPAQEERSTVQCEKDSDVGWKGGKGSGNARWLGTGNTATTAQGRLQKHTLLAEPLVAFID
eukprot:scaffold26330_cov19-Tisochrysis_lutea.AAC.3